MNVSTDYLGYWMKRFFNEYIITIRNLSRNTLKSYRDTFRLLIKHMHAENNISPDKLLITDISKERVISFLNGLQSNRGVSEATRNQRIAALQSFAKYLSLQAPEHVEWCREMRNIPKKRAEKNLITYLEKAEMDALLEMPDRLTAQGRRDYALLLFLYNTGVRAEEAASMKISALTLPARKSDKTIPIATIIGKGRKTRRCPLWDKTVQILVTLTKGRGPDDPIFLNRLGQAITRFGIYEMVTRYGKMLETKMPNVKGKRISPHTIRHTTATHLLQAGVDINTIRAWLGHVSVNTTNIYAEVNLEMKAKALQSCSPEQSTKEKIKWENDENLLSFLENL